jgi:uncharacterized membrane protein required for colicin V production
MNLIDLFAIIVIAIAILEGVYRGFINSVCKVGAFFLSWITAFLLSPLLANSIPNENNLFQTLLTYADASEKLGTVDTSKMLISQLKQTDLNTIISNANFPQPFPNLIKQNVTNHAFSAKGITTLGEYTNETIVCIMINIISFLVIFLIAALIFGFIINALDNSFRFPVLRQMDGLLGGGFGLILGCFSLFIIFMIVPLILVLVDVKQITDYLNNSFLGSFFYKSNFILNFMRGTV